MSAPLLKRRASSCPLLDQQESGSMMDIVLLGTVVAFFALCFVYTRACDRL